MPHAEDRAHQHEQNEGGHAGGSEEEVAWEMVVIEVYLRRHSGGDEVVVGDAAQIEL